MKIVLAYSGGLDTSVLLSWIKENYDAEVIAFCADIGQEEELRGLEKKALKTGASKIYIDDLREEFARDFIYPMMQAGAIYENQYLLGTSIARPLIAKRMIEIDHANWSIGRYGRGQIARNVRVQDVSERNDWTMVKVWNELDQCWGRPYKTLGFIYAR